MIKRVRIRDFKSIRDVTVDLDPVTVFVGRSGTGKSNFVQALRFLRNWLIHSGSALANEGGWGYITPGSANKGTEVSIEVEFSVSPRGAIHRYLIGFVTGGPRHGARFCEERLQSSDTTVFHRAGTDGNWHWEVEPPTLRLPSLNDEPMLSQLPAIPDAVEAYTALTSGIGFYALPNVVLTPKSVAGDRQLLDQLPGLHDDANNFMDVMRSIAQNLHQPELKRGILAALRKVNPTLASVELNSITQPKHAIVAHRIGEKLLDLKLDQESDGFRRFYAQLLALYQQPPKLTNIFEEPENAVYPGALSMLADEFKAAPEQGRGQVLLTTHSPALLEHFDVENLRVVDIENGATVIGKVSQEQREAVQESLLTTGELLHVDPARIARSAESGEVTGG